MFKRVEAIIRKSALKKVVEALKAIDYPGITITEVEGHGKQRGLTSQYRDKTQIVFLPKMKIEVVVDEKMVHKVVEAIMTTARTGEIGDGKIFVTPVHEVYRIRTGERGSKA